MELLSTVVAGVLIFVLGQIVIKILVEPWQQFRELIGRIAHALPVYGHGHAGYEEGARVIRSHAGELQQRTYAMAG